MKVMSGKRVLITGAAKGIGFHTAEKFAVAGADLIITDIAADALAETAKYLEKYEINLDTYVVDVSSRKQVEAMAKEVLERHGPVDILINNAGMGFNKELSDMTFAEWEKLININFWGTLYHTYAFLPSMLARAKGQIINVSSGQVYFRLPTWGAYTATKMAMGGFSEILYYELRPRGVTVSTVYPFMVNTGFYKTWNENTAAAKLSKQLLPYYSNKPETVANKIFKTARKKSRVNMVHILNYIGFYMHFIPFVYGIVSRIAYWFYGQKRETPENYIDRSKWNCLVKMFKEKRFGFKMDEVMTGDHEFEPSFGKPGKKFMDFIVTWGPTHLSEWINPYNKKFFSNTLVGHVTIEGLCTDAYCEGTLALKYFSENKIVYDFNFEVKGKKYHYVGEKVNIKIWNLHKTHTTCYGILTEEDTGKIVSRSVTHFRFRTIPAFLWSLRLG